MSESFWLVCVDLNQSRILLKYCVPPCVDEVSKVQRISGCLASCCWAHPSVVTCRKKASFQLPISHISTHQSVKKGFIMAVVKCVIRIRSTSLWQHETCFVEQLPMNSGPLAVLYCSSKHSHHTTRHTLSAGAAAVVSQTDSPVQLLLSHRHTVQSSCCASFSTQPWQCVVPPLSHHLCMRKVRGIVEQVTMWRCCNAVRACSVECLVGPVYGITHFYSSVVHTLTHLSWKWGPYICVPQLLYVQHVKVHPQAGRLVVHKYLFWSDVVETDVWADHHCWHMKCQK